MRTLVLAVLVTLGVAAAPADAAHCHDGVPIVGYQHCRRFGQGWAPPAITWDFGVAALHLDLAPIDQLVSGTAPPGTYHVVTSGPLGVDSIGPRIRSVFGITTHLYVGSELTMGAVERAPQLQIDQVARGGGALPSTTGFTISDVALVGAQTTIDRIRIGTELAIGVRAISLTNAGLGDRFGPDDAFLALELHQRIGYWVTHWISIDAEAGTDLLERHVYTLGLSIGLHVFPYDGTR